MNLACFDLACCFLSRIIQSLAHEQHVADGHEKQNGRYQDRKDESEFDRGGAVRLFRKLLTDVHLGADLPDNACREAKLLPIIDFRRLWLSLRKLHKESKNMF